jgi:hypothetical protein
VTAPEFVTSSEFDSVVSIVSKSIDEISNDSLIKIVWQLEFWTEEKLPEDDIITLTEQLVHTSLLKKRLQISKFLKFGLEKPSFKCQS